jgi:hypothetical protein
MLIKNKNNYRSQQSILIFSCLYTALFAVLLLSKRFVLFWHFPGIIAIVLYITLYSGIDFKDNDHAIFMAL